MSTPAAPPVPSASVLICSVRVEPMATSPDVATSSPAPTEAVRFGSRSVSASDPSPATIPPEEADELAWRWGLAAACTESEPIGTAAPRVTPSSITAEV